MEQCFLRQSSCQLQLFSLQVTTAYEKYRFNAAVRGLMELSKVLQEAHAQKNMCKTEFHQALLVLLKLLAPMAPHISSELWEGECGAYVHLLLQLPIRIFN